MKKVRHATTYNNYPGIVVEQRKQDEEENEDEEDVEKKSTTSELKMVKFILLPNLGLLDQW